MGMKARPRKLNRENFEDWPSVKIGPHENFTLYGSGESLPDRLSWAEWVHHQWEPASPYHTTCRRLRALVDSCTATRYANCMCRLSQSRPYFPTLFDSMLIKVLLNFSLTIRPLHWGWYPGVFIFLVPINLQTSWTSNKRKLAISSIGEELLWHSMTGNDTLYQQAGNGLSCPVGYCKHLWQFGEI